MYHLYAVVATLAHHTCVTSVTLAVHVVHSATLGLFTLYVGHALSYVQLISLLAVFPFNAASVVVFASTITFAVP